MSLIADEHSSWTTVEDVDVFFVEILRQGDWLVVLTPTGTPRIAMGFDFKVAGEGAPR